MSNWPVQSGGFVQLSDSGGTQLSIVTPATAYAWSGWVEVAASAPACTSLRVFGAAYAYDRTQLQIGVGASGSEIEIADILLTPANVQSGGGSAFGAGDFDVPVAIRAGSRVSIRARASSANVQTFSRVTGITGSFVTPCGFSSALLMGLNTSTLAAATSVSENASSATAPGAWVSIGNLPYAIKAIAIVPSPIAGEWANGERATWQLGAGAQPQVIATKSFCGFYNDWPISGASLVFPASLPSGTPISARWHSHHAGTANCRVAAILYR